MTLYARRRPLAGRAADARLLASGELLDAPDGSPIGQFYTNCFCLETPFGPHGAAASNLEVQVLQLKEGTLFGLGAGGRGGGAKARALVGGTDRYAGLTGSYIERAGAHARPDVVELVVTFAS